MTNPTSDDRHTTFLSLSSQVKRQLRAAYDRFYEKGRENQVTLASKLGTSQSAISKRLKGHINMTMETIADMVWALNCRISVKIYDPTTTSDKEDAMSDKVTVPASDMSGGHWYRVVYERAKAEPDEDLVKKLIKIAYRDYDEPVHFDACRVIVNAYRKYLLATEPPLTDEQISDRMAP